MARIKVKYVGPIKEGLQENDGFLEFKGVTLFIGDQGSGKSTIAKLYSTLSWIEKSLMRGDRKPEYYTQYNRFEKQLAYQGIDGYLTERSEVVYEGAAYTITYYGKEKQFSAVQNTNPTDYVFPKIMYVPAERNFLTVVGRPDLVKRLPPQLYDFLAEYDEAKNTLKEKDRIQLPIKGIQFRYQKNGKKSFILGSDYEVDLMKASSGFQSLTPLYLVTRYLTESIDPEKDTTRKSHNLADSKRIQEELDKILHNKDLSPALRQAALEKLSEQFSYGCFINVVEEPEQNLYPDSQQQLLYALLGYKNTREADRLVLTTHSLYLLGYLGVCIKAHHLNQLIAPWQKSKREKAIKKMEKIVPAHAAVNPKNLSLYQLHLDGSIENIKSKYGLPCEDNELNEQMMETNDLFSDLLELQREWQ